MELEKRIVNEINSLNISIGLDESNQIKDIDLVKPLIYGIGIDITKKIIHIIENQDIFIDKNYLEYNYENAIIEFKKDFLIYNFQKARGDKKIAGTNMKLGNTENSSQIIFNQLANRLKINLNNLIENYNEEIISKESFDKSNNLEEIAKKRIKRYCGNKENPKSGIISINSINEYIRKNIETLSNIFISVAKEYAKEPQILTGVINECKNMSLSDAINTFKINYLRSQFYACDMKCEIMAEKLGKKQSAIRVLLSDHQIPMTQLRYEAKLGVAKELK